MTILILTDVYGEDVQISADAIETYSAFGAFTTLTLTSGAVKEIKNTPEELNAALGESYIMIKRVSHVPTI